ncbi:MAG: hypothetical protein V1844_14855 [Pseudomonadota bacterium]
MFHIPSLSYIDQTSRTLSFWADLLYELNPAYPTEMIFKLTNAGIVTNPSYLCVPSTLSGDLKIHIPDVLFPNGSSHFWVDLEYGPALSTEGKVFFLVTDFGILASPK